MAEIKKEVKGCQSAVIEKVSKLLIEQGIDGAEFYYFDEGRELTPFFRILKKYKKERETDPEWNAIYIDIEFLENMQEEAPELTVYGTFFHEHLATPEQAVELICGLNSGEISEVGFVLFTRLILGGFLKNTGDPEKNINILDADLKELIPKLYHMPLAGSAHVHEYSNVYFPYTMYFGEMDKLIREYDAYLFSQNFAESPDIFYIE